MRITGTAWAIWALLSAGSFLVLEGVAMFNRIQDDTLTATTVRDVPWPVGLAVFIAGIAFAVWHFLPRYRNPDRPMHEPEPK